MSSVNPIYIFLFVFELQEVIFCLERETYILLASSPLHGNLYWINERAERIGEKIIKISTKCVDLSINLR